MLLFIRKKLHTVYDPAESEFFSHPLSAFLKKSHLLRICLKPMIHRRPKYTTAPETMQTIRRTTLVKVKPSSQNLKVRNGYRHAPIAAAAMIILAYLPKEVPANRIPLFARI